MQLTLGAHRYDLTTRALVLGARGAPGDLVAQGADLVQLAIPDQPVAVPVCVTASDQAAVELALAGGASLVCLPAPSAEMLRGCALGGVAVIVPPSAVDDAAASGLSADRIVPDTRLVDVAGGSCPVAVIAVAVIRGARIVRTTDVRAARRVCDVLAAVMEAR